MKCFKTFLFLLFLLAAMRLSATDLHVLCTTDLHGHLEKIPAIAPALRQYGKDCIRIDAGDTLSGTFEADRLAGKPMIQLLNMLNYDIWVPGNHDFEMPFETFRKRAGEFKGTVLGAQWKWQSYTPEKWRMFQKKGYRIAVIGLTAPSMPHRILDPEQDGVFQQAYHTLKKLLPKIRKQRPDAIILVMHNGMYAKYFGASAAARAFPEINLILGGHSHQEEQGRNLFSSYFVQAGCHANAVADITIRFDDRTRRIKQIRSNLIYPEKGVEDSEIKAFVDPVLHQLKTVKYQRAGTALQPLRLPARREKRSALGEICAKALLDCTGADAALARLRTFPEPEKAIQHFNELDLFRFFPYRNRICTIEIEKDDFAELAQSIALQYKNKKRLSIFAGDLSYDWKNGELHSSRSKITLALTDFTLVSTPVFLRKIQSGSGKLKIYPITERALFRRQLRKAPAKHNQ